MISYNHYAGGTVGDFLYRRVAGIEATSGGYKTFTIRPVPGGGITWAKAEVMTAYGKAKSDWKIEDSRFTINVTVPFGTECTLILPGGEEKVLTGGQYEFSE